MKEGKSSFLKKRTKKLLHVRGSAGRAALTRWVAAIGKSFLVLFFKKERFSFAGLP
jgi:hypothetical protein